MTACAPGGGGGIEKFVEKPAFVYQVGSTNWRHHRTVCSFNALEICEVKLIVLTLEVVEVRTQLG